MTSVATEGTPAESGPLPAAGPMSARPVALSGQQRLLLRALDERNASLGVMYRGSLAVLNDATNPDRLALGAHDMRELMEKLPEFLDVSTKAQTESLREKVGSARKAYLGMRGRTACYAPADKWDGAIDGHLRRFLLLIEGFFIWFDAHCPRRRDEIRVALTRLDASGRDLPAPLALLNVDAWDKHRDFFQSVSHHRHRTDETEFGQWMDAFERFLLERLAPRTFEDFAEIDALLGEESGDA